MHWRHQRVLRKFHGRVQRVPMLDAQLLVNAADQSNLLVSLSECVVTLRYEP